MKEPIDDGEPAFARPMSESQYLKTISEAQPGMSLRDWLAGQALAGFDVSMYSDIKAGFTFDGDEVADRVYEIADAMLAKRRKDGVS